LIVTTKTYQQLQLEATPERVVPFLRGIATNRNIRIALFGAGYSDAEQAEGWQLLHAASGYTGQKAAVDVTADMKARNAITELDNWDETGFRRTHAALERLHPEQDAFVFSGLEASRGPSAVLGIAKYLDRLDRLEKGSEAERAAVATLTKRGITTEERQRLRGLITLAETASAVEVAVTAASTEAEQKSLEALAAWYKDWSETARAVIRRRDQLILLGLAKRKTPSNPVSATTASAAQ
jgi:alpha-L-fucosidase